MSKKLICFLVAGAALTVASTDAARDRSISFQNSVRIGFDDNVYLTSNNETSTVYITDIAMLSAKARFSSRTDAQLFYQPELRYRVDAEPKVALYQDLYAGLNHAASERVSLSASDRFRFINKDSLPGSTGQSNEQNLTENFAQGSANVMVGSMNDILLAAGHKMRMWEDDAYAKLNDFTVMTLDGSFQRELLPNTTYGFVGSKYDQISYDSDTRGGYDSLTVYGGGGHSFSSKLEANARVGYSLAAVDAGSLAGVDSDTPYFSGGIDYKPSSRTSMSLKMGYSLYQSNNSFYNAQQRLELGGALKHDLTGKFTVVAGANVYQDDYSADAAIQAGAKDADEMLIRLHVRGVYQLTRRNFLEAGYAMSQRTSDFFGDYSRNQIDMGWRLKL